MLLNPIHVIRVIHGSLAQVYLFSSHGGSKARRNERVSAVACNLAARNAVFQPPCRLVRTLPPDPWLPGLDPKPFFAERAVTLQRMKKGRLATFEEGYLSA